MEYCTRTCFDVSLILIEWLPSFPEKLNAETWGPGKGPGKPCNKNLAEIITQRRSLNNL